MQEIRWGIIGCGRIAHTFASSLAALPTGILKACASRSPERAHAFAAEFGLASSYTDYESLVSDPSVDAVYIATTHNFHAENVRLCLDHGKHVLCEKPLTVNAAQTRDLIEQARSRNLFLMEALWTRFLPAIQKLKELLESEAIGIVQTVYANFCLGRNLPPEDRLRNLELAGGSLLDLGIYPITMADLVFGCPPASLRSMVRRDPETGVDELSVYLFEYDGGRRAVLSAGYAQAAPVEAIISGTRGYIRLPHFLGARELHVHPVEGDPQTFEYPYTEGENFKYEIAQAMKCISRGETESSIMPLSKTLEVMETMDALRAEWGLRYPGE